MNHRQNELLVQRGRLLERIATQRAALRGEMLPVRTSLYKADRWWARAHSVIDYVKQHPSLVALGVAGLFLVKTERVWRWTKRGFVAWRAWRAFRDGVLAAGSRVRS